MESKVNGYESNLSEWSREKRSQTKPRQNTKKNPTKNACHDDDEGSLIYAGIPWNKFIRFFWPDFFFVRQE
jgi:hypothetical protein